MQMGREVVLITGAGSGLGRQLALLLAAEGQSIAALDLQPEPLAELEQELKRRDAACAWAVADVTDRSVLSAAVANLEQQLGPIDLLIPSAGIGIETSALSFSAEVFEKLVHINLIGVANSVAAVLSGMLSRKRGHLVGISSLASLGGLPLMAGYCASKAGLNAMMEALRIELKPHGIAVTTVCPGWIRTPMTTHLQEKIHNMMDVDAAAQQIIEAIRRKRALHVFPRSDARRLKFLRWLPTSWRDAVITRMMRRIADK
jgi:short-subunit dehydrogenase